MRRGLRAFVLGAAALALASCQREPTTAENELVAEVRALRLLLRDRATDQQPPAPPREAIESAMAPLQNALAGLAEAQRTLSTQQAALAAELQRWTQLVGTGLQQQRSDESQALTARLAELEQQIRSQDERHREVEAMLQQALELTADRLGDFLRRLEQPPATAPAAGDQTATPPTKPGGGTPDDPPAEARRGATTGLWWALALASVLAGWIVLLRARRAAPLSVAPEMRAATHGGTDEVPSHGAPQPASGSDVEELWAAAALLGEAIGRLKQTGADAPQRPVEAPGHPMRMADVGAPEELLALDGRTKSPDTGEPPARPAAHDPAPPPRGAARPAPAPRGSATAPRAIVCRLCPSDLAVATERVRRLLHGDPRVLRSPAPEIAPEGDALTVTFRLLPGVPPGERSRLEQSLRDAVA